MEFRAAVDIRRPNIARLLAWSRNKFAAFAVIVDVALLPENALRTGFLGTAAPLYADLALTLEIAMGVALLIGAFLARTGRYRSHAWCQSLTVLLNLVVIILVMIPSFRGRVAPKIPERLSKTYYLLATAHAASGTVAEIAALYILVAAGTNLLPSQIRLTQYKLWMRSVLVLWWLVLLLGVATYARWYVP